MTITPDIKGRLERHQSKIKKFFIRHSQGTDDVKHICCETKRLRCHNTLMYELVYEFHGKVDK